MYANIGHFLMWFFQCHQNRMYMINKIAFGESWYQLVEPRYGFLLAYEQSDKTKDDA